MWDRFQTSRFFSGLRNFIPAGLKSVQLMFMSAMWEWMVKGMERCWQFSKTRDTKEPLRYSLLFIQKESHPQALSRCQRSLSTVTCQAIVCWLRSFLAGYLDYEFYPAQNDGGPWANTTTCLNARLLLETFTVSCHRFVHLMLLRFCNLRAN